MPFPKALAKFGRKTALEIAVENCHELGRPVVVIGSDAQSVRAAMPKGVRVVLNEKWRTGQLSSLLCALKVVPKKAAFLIYPVDHPLVTKETMRKLVAEFRMRGAEQSIVMPRYGGAFGHPVIVAAVLREEFFHTETARDVIYRVAERIRIVGSASREIFEDFGTRESYERCVRQYEARLEKLRSRRRMNA